MNTGVHSDTLAVSVEQPTKQTDKKDNMEKVIAAMNMTHDILYDHTSCVPDEEMHQH